MDLDNLTPGECKFFTIKVEAVNDDDACGCTKKTYKDEIKIPICKPIGDCFSGKKGKSPYIHYFDYDGKEWKLLAEMGQRGTEGGIFSGSRKVWAKSILKKKKNNGKWRRRKPGEKLEARVYGNFIYNYCTSTKYSYRYDKTKSKKKKTCKSINK